MPHFAAYYRSYVIERQLGLPPRARRILDVGTDDGYLMRKVAAPLRLGIDLAPRLRPDDAIAVARASATAIPAAAASFDVVLAFDVLEHVADDRAMLREICRVLAPGGALYFSTPALAFRFHPAFLTPYTNRSFGHVRNGYTVPQLQALLPADFALETFFWNEPALRASFAALHFLQMVAPMAAAALTRLCYRIDANRRAGERGHIFGVVRRPDGGASAGGR